MDDQCTGEWTGQLLLLLLILHVTQILSYIRCTEQGTRTNSKLAEAVVPFSKYWRTELSAEYALYGA